MFGHQDDDQNDNQGMANEAPSADATLVHDAGIMPASDQPQTDAPQHDDTPPSAPAVTDDTPGSYIMTEPHQPNAPTVDAPEHHEEVAVAAHAVTDDLLSLKQHALQQLSPLVGHLDQTPEEKFRTTMMMIQASDDQTLIKGAYEAAQAIPDEKARAQALLDIVNEINYFTQHQESTA
jgi:hypothetical protein